MLKHVRWKIRALTLFVCSISAIVSTNAAKAGQDIVADTVWLACEMGHKSGQAVLIAGGVWYRGACDLVFLRSEKIVAAFPVDLTGRGFSLGLQGDLKLSLNAELDSVVGLTPADVMQTYRGHQIDAEIYTGYTYRFSFSGDKNGTVLKTKGIYGAAEAAGFGASFSWASLDLKLNLSRELIWGDMSPKQRADILFITDWQKEAGIDQDSRIQIVSKVLK